MEATLEMHPTMRSPRSAHGRSESMNPCAAMQSAFALQKIQRGPNARVRNRAAPNFLGNEWRESTPPASTHHSLARGAIMFRKNGRQLHLKADKPCCVPHPANDPLSQDRSA